MDEHRQIITNQSKLRCYTLLQLPVIWPKKCEAEIINKISYWIRVESFFENTTLQFLLEVQGNLYHTLRWIKRKKKSIVSAWDLPQIFCFDWKALSQIKKQIRRVYLVSKPICITTFYRYFFCINSEICKDILEHEKSDVNCGANWLLKNFYNLVIDFATYNNTVFMTAFQFLLITWSDKVPLMVTTTAFLRWSTLTKKGVSKSWRKKSHTIK